MYARALMTDDQARQLALQHCLEACQRCHRTCLQAAGAYSAAPDGQRIDIDHFRLLLDCAAVCQLMANFILSNSAVYAELCAACAKICAICAQRCEQLSDSTHCRHACQQCAESCLELMGG